MALIKCPECGKDISSHASSCPNCGWPVSDDIKYELEIKRLTDKIKPIEFTTPEPRMKACIKCGEPFYYHLNAPDGEPFCKCNFNGKPYPGVEVDYFNNGYMIAGLGECLYFLEQCIIPRNIGDTESKEYQDAVDDLYRQVRESEEATGKKILPVPQDEEDFNDIAPWRKPGYIPPKPFHIPEPTIKNIPKCPICNSTDLSKISSLTKALKIATFGIFGMDDAGKTWKCNNCGSKF